MEINQIQTYLESPDSQERLKAITSLREYDSEIAVPLLKTKMYDQEFIVRSFVAMGLGKKRNSDSFAALLELVSFDHDGNVRAEAANSLSLFGEVSASYLVQFFKKDHHWLVRRSIIAALVEMNKSEELLEVCLCGLTGQELTIQQTVLETLGFLAHTNKENEALQQLLAFMDADSWRLRLSVAKALRAFNHPEAQQALITLKQDEDHRVVGAVLEKLLES